jgi:hypothetical protein
MPYANSLRVFTVMKQLLPDDQIFEDFLHPGLTWGIVSFSAHLLLLSSAPPPLCSPLLLRSPPPALHAHLTPQIAAVLVGCK